MVLKKLKWKGNELCPLCNKPETVDHIFFQCIIARFVWSCFKEALGWDRAPTSLWEVFWDWVPVGCTDYDPKLFSFTIICWSLWLSRHKMRMEKEFSKHPGDVLYLICYKIQKWGVLLRSEDRDHLDKLRMIMEN